MKWTANILILIYVFINLINNTMNLTTSTISLVAFIVLNYFIKTDKIKNKLTLNKIDETDELGTDPMLFEAYKFIVFTGSCDAMTLKRQLNIGYNRALNIIDNLESLGIVSKINKENKRLVNIFPNTEEEAKASIIIESLTTNEGTEKTNDNFLCFEQPNNKALNINKVTDIKKFYKENFNIQLRYKQDGFMLPTFNNTTINKKEADNLIRSLIRYNSPETLKLSLINIEGYQNIPHLYTRSVNRKKDINTVLATIHEEIENRQNLFVIKKVKTIEKYNAKEKTLPYLFIFAYKIDEELLNIINQNYNLGLRVITVKENEHA